MRSLTKTELTSVTGAAANAAGRTPPTPAQIAAARAALAAKGITISLDLTAGTATIHTPKGDKVVTLPAKALAYIEANHITA